MAIGEFGSAPSLKEGLTFSSVKTSSRLSFMVFEASSSKMTFLSTTSTRLFSPVVVMVGSITALAYSCCFLEVSGFKILVEGRWFRVSWPIGGSFRCDKSWPPTEVRSGDTSSDSLT